MTYRLAKYFILAVTASCLISQIAAQEPQTDGAVELRKGNYENAIKLLSARLASNPTDEATERYLLRAYRETGHYSEAEAAGRKFLQKNPDAGSIRHELAELLAITGRYNDAINEFEHASRNETVPAQKLASDLRCAEVLELVGQQERARTIYEALVNYYKEQSPQDAITLSLVARALVHLERYHDANDVYRVAIEADSTELEAQLGAAELFTQKYNYSDAAGYLADAVAINPNSARAQLDVALNKSMEGGEEMQTALARALATNPNFVDALAFKAAQALEAGRFEAASVEIERALKINPQSPNARALRAAMFYLEDRDIAAEIAATLAISPRYGALYDTLAHFATITRRTEQAAQFARKAIEISPQLWSAHLTLGMSLLRMGQMEEGRAEVTKAFEGDPFNLWAKNTLDLLDTMKDFRETRRANFVIKTSAQETSVLSAYAGNLLEEANAKLTAKYHFTPKGPIRIEMFPNHEDFAVRALGIPGLGALGVCFGQVIAADSPSARETGEFNWGSTLWHEYTHVITLQMTDYRIPRWFSEGLSVYEERRARPGWGDDWNPIFVRAFAGGRWFKISDLDSGFQRPHTPQDVPIAYFEASQVCEFIAERFGFDAILRMLSMYRDKANTPEILRQVLKLSETDFDRAFSSWVEAKAKPLQAALQTEANVVASMSKEEVLKMLATEDTFALHVRAGDLLRADNQLDEAARHYRRAIELFPYFTAQGNPYESLATLLEEKGDLSQAADVLDSLTKQDENNLQALKSLARLRLQLGDKPRAIDALRMSFYINPFEYSMHTEAGELSMAAGDYARALEEFQVAVALQPPNIAEANYNLANAYHLLGRQEEAKHAVLRSLEAAPRYEKAQELLLKIVGQ